MPLPYATRLGEKACVSEPSRKEVHYRVEQVAGFNALAFVVSDQVTIVIFEAPAYVPVRFFASTPTG